jgi:hypothetical protein
MIYYLAQGYSFHPDLAIMQAQEWTQQLLTKGYTVFSPIMHTHYYDCRFHDGTDYVAWDLALLAAMCKPLVYVAELDEGDKYQPNVCMLFAMTCFSLCNPDECLNASRPLIIIEGKRYHWMSEGAQREYEFAKEKHIRCLLLDPFLNNEEVEL